MFVARLRNCSDAPLHVLPVEFELCFGDVVVVLLDGLVLTFVFVSVVSASLVMENDVWMELEFAGG